MQTLYATAQDKEKPNQRIEKYLLENLNHTFRSFIYNLYILWKTAGYERIDAVVRREKYFPTEEDKRICHHIFDNTVINHLEQIEQIEQWAHKEKLDVRTDSDLFRTFFHQLQKTGEYKSFCQKTNVLLTEEQAILTFLYQDILWKQDLFHQTLEDLFPGWLDDRELVYHHVLRFINGIGPETPAQLLKMSRELHDSKQFARELLHQTLAHQQELENLILPLLEHWDPDRVALLDMLLMKLNLAEWLYFPDIPIKVSLNEYIEIAKVYSTPKSGAFINGILDSLLKKLQHNGQIHKSGRGERDQ